MNNNRRHHIGAYLTTLALLGCTQLASAVDTSSAQAPDVTRMAVGPTILGSPKIGTAQSIHGFVADIEKLSIANQDFRHVIYTAKHAQLVVMALKPGEDIGAEAHQRVDQFIRVEEGTGEAVLDNVRTPIRAGYAVLIPAGTKHDIVNTGTAPMKLYTLYTPPQHRDGVIHHTRSEAEQDHEHFDGKTTQ